MKTISFVLFFILSSVVLGCSQQQSNDNDVHNNDLPAYVLETGNMIHLVYEQDCDSGYCDPDACTLYLKSSDKNGSEVRYATYLYRMSRATQAEDRLKVCQGMKPDDERKFVFTVKDSVQCEEISETQTGSPSSAKTCTMLLNLFK